MEGYLTKNWSKKQNKTKQKQKGKTPDQLLW